MKKKALITGITGQDGSYLADFLLEEGYEVYGMVRRSSTENFERIDHIRDRIHFVQADLLDQLSIISIIKEIDPGEIYNLAAQSFVPTSWSQPVLTGEFTAIGVTRMLEAIKLVNPEIRFYQASSSEMFGKVRESPQNEETPFYPRSPYGVAKVYGHWITVNYRESYDLFACSGILFNHESVPGWTPVLIRQDGALDILPIEEIMTNHMHERERSFDGLEVWEDGQFVKVSKGTAYPHDSARSDKGVMEVSARCGVVEATRDHCIFSAEGEIPAGKLNRGQRILSTEHYPKPTEQSRVTPEWARFLGIFVGDGYANWREGAFKARIRSDDETFLQEAAALWRACTGGYASYSDARSGITGQRIERGAINLNGAPGVAEWLSSACYTKSRHKRVPKLILNADLDVWREFLAGYNRADGLKAGHGNYEFKNFKTHSPTLASQLLWMVEKAIGQRTIVHVLRVERKGEEYRYYSINMNSPEDNQKGAHLRRDRDEILHVRPLQHRGYLFDLTTESGRFAAGVGNILIHNSPRRGREFVTRKVSYGVAKIKHGLADKIRLGNLEAERDWGYAGDYVRAMWLMLQQDEPQDYVVATGITHSVQDLVEVAFGCIDLKWEDYVETDPALRRPADVDHLQGDSSKASKILGWKPEVNFEKLVEMMVRHDIEITKP